MSTTEEVASPAAAVLARRQSRTTPQQKQVRKRTHSEDGSEETGSDSEWDPEQEDDPLRDTLNGERGEGEQEVRGRPYHTQWTLHHSGCGPLAPLAVPVQDSQSMHSALPL